MSIPTIPVEILEIEKVIVFNSAHITKSDSKIIDNIADGVYDESELMVDSHIYGFRVYIELDHDEDTFNAILNNVADEGLSKEFTDIMRICRAHKANWLKLDCDGRFYPQLPVFDY